MVASQNITFLGSTYYTAVRKRSLVTGFFELSVTFRDFALHHGWPPSGLLSVAWIKRSFGQTRWSISLDLIEIRADHYGAWRFNSCKNPRRLPSEFVARFRVLRISAVDRCNGE
jgi:hypothetical protein